MKRIILFFGLIFLFACNQSGNQATADRMMDMEESSRAKMVSEMDQDQPSAQTQKHESSRIFSLFYRLLIYRSLAFG
jgi:hypothetical protein